MGNDLLGRESRVQRKVAWPTKYLERSSDRFDRQVHQHANSACMFQPRALTLNQMVSAVPTSRLTLSPTHVWRPCKSPPSHSHYFHSHFHLNFFSCTPIIHYPFPPHTWMPRLVPRRSSLISMYSSATVRHWSALVALHVTLRKATYIAI